MIKWVSTFDGPTTEGEMAHNYRYEDRKEVLSRLVDDVIEQTGKVVRRHDMRNDIRMALVGAAVSVAMILGTAGLMVLIKIMYFTGP